MSDYVFRNQQGFTLPNIRKAVKKIMQADSDEGNSNTGLSLTKSSSFSSLLDVGNAEKKDSVEMGILEHNCVQAFDTANERRVFQTVYNLLIPASSKGKDERRGLVLLKVDFMILPEISTSGVIASPYSGSHQLDHLCS